MLYIKYNISFFFNSHAFYAFFYINEQVNITQHNTQQQYVNPSLVIYKWIML